MAVKITLDEFLSLPKQEQLDVIFTLGDFLQATSEGKSRVILYAVDCFFVELYFDPKLIKIKNIHAFDRGKTLDKYSKNLENIL